MAEIIITNKDISHFCGVAVLGVRGGVASCTMDAGELFSCEQVYSWNGGERGEENTLAETFAAAIDGCTVRGCGLAVDVQSYAAEGYRFSYLYSVFADVLSRRTEDLATPDRIIFFGVTGSEDIINAGLKCFAQPQEEYLKQHFGEAGDVLQHKFEKNILSRKGASFGDYVMAVAANKGFNSRGDVCAATGISKFTLSKLINGRSKPSKDTLEALATGLKLSGTEVKELYNYAGYHFGDIPDADEKLLSPAENFGEYLSSIAESKGVGTRSQLCMASGISKYTMSKLMNGRSVPSKDTLAALAIGMKLSGYEAEELYNFVGYHLGDTDFVDRVVKFFIAEKNYDIDEVNYCLFYYGYPPLGERPRDEKIIEDIDFD